MRFRYFGALLAALLVGTLATAQEQKGSIEGYLTDEQGGALPGATVEATSTSVGGVITTYADASGRYRFPALRPGTYNIKGSLAGFTSAQRSGVDLQLGQVLRVDLALKIGGLAEEITIEAQGEIIDVKQSAKADSIRDEMIEKLPRGRNFTSVVTQSASANNEGDLGGISIDGAGASENRYIIDGVDTTDIQDGTSAANLITDFIDEVQVKSSGYAAEYGGATGGVINVITKSGGNEWSGTAGGYAQFDDLQGELRPTLRTDPNDSNVAQTIREEPDDWSRFEPGFTIGGPVVSDRFWMFGGYQPEILRTYRTVDFGDNDIRTYREAETRHYGTVNATAQLNSKLRVRGGVAFNPFYRRGHLPGKTGTSNPDADWAGLGEDEPNWSTSFNVDYSATNNLYLGARGGHFSYGLKEKGFDPARNQRCSRSNLDIPGIPPEFQCQNGNAVLGDTFGTDFDDFARTQFTADATYFATAAGDHAIKAGIQYDRISNKVASGYAEGDIRFYWGSTLNTADGRSVRGEYGWMRVIEFGTFGDVSSDQVGLYLQDAWTVNDKLTLNLGIRTESEQVPTFRTNLGQAADAIDFGFGDKLAPRAGFAYDIMGDGNWKVYGSWGVFYDIFKLEMPRGLFGGDTWLDWRYTLDSFNWTELGLGANCPPDCEGELIEVRDFRFPSNTPGMETIDPNLKPMRSQEFTLGFAHRLNPTMSISGRYVHKQLDRTIEDVGILRIDENGAAEVYFIANPGEGVAEFTLRDTCPTCPAQPKAKRDYDGIELEFTKRMSDNWSLHASYLYSRLEGNYSGLSSSDEEGRNSPNVNRFFDNLIMSFDENGNPVFGPLGTDRPHQLKLQGLYDFGQGSSIGLNYYIASGTPVSRTASIAGFPVFYEGRETDGRTPVFSQADVYLQHEFRLGDGSALQVSLNVLNLFDQETETRYDDEQLRNDIPLASPEEFFAGLDVSQIIATDANIDQDPLFLLPEAWQARRSVRLGLKYIF